MRKATWQQAVKTCVDPKRAKVFIEKLEGTGAGRFMETATEEQAKLLCTVLGGSQAQGETLVSHPGWMDLFSEPEALKHPRQKQGLRREINLWLKPCLQSRDYAGALGKIRELKQREMLRLAIRDLARLGTLVDIILEISNVADACLDVVCQVCQKQLMEKYGQPFHQDAQGDWFPTEFSIIGLGKLGGQELNYSSDVDVVFVYSEEGGVYKKPPAKESPGSPVISNHSFFARLAESIIAEFTRITPQGALFRIDLRLRPEGNSGPLVRSLPGYENYYSQWGQTWERMMLIKARGVAGDRDLAGEFLEMVQPFRYPRSIGERVFKEVAAMKERIETEVVKAGEIDRNVKLGRGGIREIEFIAQTLQVLNAGRLPFLQEPKTLLALDKLAQYKFLASSETESLKKDYCFLRDVEHRLQMEADRQTHTIPTDSAARTRLALLMGFRKLSDFETALREHTVQVRTVYDKLLRADTSESHSNLPGDFDTARDEWLKLLANCSFRDAESAFRLLHAFVHGPGYIHVSSRTVELAWELLGRIFSLCPRKDVQTREILTRQLLSDPDRVLARLDSFVAAYGARSVMFETWASNPSLFELLLLLFDRSEFLAEIAIRVPDLVDDLVLSGRLRRAKTSAEILRDLRHGWEDSDQALWLRKYHQAEFMRIGLRDILGLADFEQNLMELTALADACVQYALDVVLRNTPYKTPPFVILGLGKYGGGELTYGSDLDILFVADPKVKNISPLQGLAAKTMELLSAASEAGVVFETDARLRPDGEKGLLVNTLKACEEYYRQRALLWEIQTITRVRAVAGNMELGQRFQKLAATLSNFKQPNQPVAAYSKDWRQQIVRMRYRIETERVAAGKQALAFKTGAGGLVDAEFIAQTLCLAQGWQEGNTLRALERARNEGVISQPDADNLIESYRKLRRIEGTLRRWSYEGESEFPDDPAPQYRVAVRCGYANVETFFKTVASYRTAIRHVYAKVMGPLPG